MTQAAINETTATQVRGVPAEHVVALWPKVEPILKRVVEPRSGYNLDHVLTKLQLCHWQLWVIGDFQACAITCFENRPLGCVLWVQYIVGTDMNEWLDDWEKAVDAIAQDNGCVATEFAGRKGWCRVQKQHSDYKIIAHVCRKEYS